MCRCHVLSVAILFAGLGCGGGALVAPPTEPPAIRGTITAVSEARVLIEEQPGDVWGSAKASVRLLPTTRLVRRSGGSVAPSELRVGQLVSAWFAGPVAESYPVQATASVIVLEP